MDVIEFAKIVRELRAAQKRYFRDRDGATLRESKQLEARVDKLTAEILRGPSLLDGFGGPKGGAA